MYAGNTIYIADSHPNSTKPKHRNCMNVNSYKKQRSFTETRTNVLLKDIQDYRIGTVSDRSHPGVVLYLVYKLSPSTTSSRVVGKPYSHAHY